MEYIIRSATPDDYDLIYILKSQSVRPYVEKIWGWDENYQQNDFDRDFSQIDQFKVIEINGEFIGFVQYHLEHSRYHVVEIHLLPEYRGNGLGSNILKAIQEICIAQGKKIQLGCFKEKAETGHRGSSGFGCDQGGEIYRRGVDGGVVSGLCKDQSPALVPSDLPGLHP